MSLNLSQVWFTQSTILSSRFVFLFALSFFLFPSSAALGSCGDYLAYGHKTDFMKTPVASSGGSMTHPSTPDSYPAPCRGLECRKTPKPSNSVPSSIPPSMETVDAILIEISPRLRLSSSYRESDTLFFLLDSLSTIFHPPRMGK
jgi:hypothetical protein